MKLLLLKEKGKNPRSLLVPNEITELSKKGYNIYFQSGIGNGCGYDDKDYINAGAKIIKKVSKDFNSYDVICKAGEIKPCLLRKASNQAIFWCYTNPVSKSKFLFNMIKRKATLVSLKSIQSLNKDSIFQVSEQMKGQFGVYLAGYHLSKANKKSLGKLLGKVDEHNSTIFIVGGCDASTNSAIKSALCLGSDVVVFSYDDKQVDTIKNNDTFKQLSRLNKCTLSVFKYDFEKLFNMINQADVILMFNDNPDHPTHEVFNEKMISVMRKGSVFIDLSADYGLASNTERKLTTVDKSILVSNDIIHFSVEDISKFYPTTFANVISKINAKYLTELIECKGKITDSTLLSPAIITYQGKLTNEEIANNFNLNYTKLNDIK